MNARVWCAECHNDIEPHTHVLNDDGYPAHPDCINQGEAA